jgi:hypothetical protein
MRMRPQGNTRVFGRPCDGIWASVPPHADSQSTGDRRRPDGGQAMRIDRCQFGSITIDGKTYDHDVMIGLSGEVSKRKKKLSKQQYGTSHVVSKAEAKSVYEKGCDLIIIGSGQEGNVHHRSNHAARLRNGVVIVQLEIEIRRAEDFDVRISHVVPNRWAPLQRQ